MLFDLLVGPDKHIRPPGSPPHAGKFRVTQEFGCTNVPGEPPFKNCDGFHRGIDIGDLKCNTPVFAAHAGRVRFADEVPVAGPHKPEKVVVLNHGDGWGTSYGHLSSIAVEDKQRVVLGQKIGTIGDTGNANGCHLHFAVKSGLPSGWTRHDFFPFSGDQPGRGRWRNPWPLLMQNVTIHPRIGLFDVRIRSSPDLGESVFATTEADGTIRRFADNFDLGAIQLARKYGGRVPGEEYEINGVRRKTWEMIELDGAFRFIATPLAKVSAI